MRRRILAGLAVVLMAGGLAACGNTKGSSGSSDDEGRPLLPLSSSSSSAVGATAAMSAEVGGDDAVGSPMMAPARPVEYRLAAGVTAPASKAPAYKFVPEAKAGDAKSISAKVLAALDVPGQVEVIGRTRWYFEPEGGGDGAMSGGVVVACTPDGDCSKPEPRPAPPGVPTAAEARLRMEKILVGLGVDPASGVVSVSGDENPYQRQVTFVPSLDGRSVNGLDTAVAFGENGRMEFASGTLGRFEKLGVYPLIGLEEAVDRLRSGFGGGIQTMEAQSGAPSASSGAASEPMPVEPDGGTGAGATPPGPPRAARPDADPAPEPEVVEITGAELAHSVVWPSCEDGDIYVVPAFRLLPAERLGFEIPAVSDTSLAGAANGVTDGARVACTDQPVGKPEPGPAEPTGRAETDPAKPVAPVQSLPAERARP